MQTILLVLQYLPNISRQLAFVIEKQAANNENKRAAEQAGEAKRLHQTKNIIR